MVAASLQVEWNEYGAGLHVKMAREQMFIIILLLNMKPLRVRLGPLLAEYGEPEKYGLIVTGYH